MPRRNHRAQRRVRPRGLRVEQPTLTTEQMAQRLVINGYASPQILSSTATHYSRTRNG
jgi:hypothetical protein